MWSLDSLGGDIHGYSGIAVYLKKNNSLVC